MSFGIARHAFFLNIVNNFHYTNSGQRVRRATAGFFFAEHEGSHLRGRLQRPRPPSGGPVRVPTLSVRGRTGAVAVRDFYGRDPEPDFVLGAFVL